MIVTVQIAAGFRYYLSDVNLLLEGVECEVATGSTVRDVLEHVRFPPDITSIIFINGHNVPMNTQLTDHDRIYLAMPMVGG